MSTCPRGGTHQAELNPATLNQWLGLDPVSVGHHCAIAIHGQQVRCDRGTHRIGWGSGADDRDWRSLVVDHHPQPGPLAAPVGVVVNERAVEFHASAHAIPVTCALHSA